MPPFIYMDHAATTPVRGEVLEAMTPFFGARFGNPSSAHRVGRDARTALDEARERVALALGAAPDEVCFTSGGTESDNLALIGGWRGVRDRGRPGIVTTPFEHKAVLEAVHAIAREGGEERILGLRDATVEPQSYAELVTSSAAVVSVMWVNNEVGALQDIPSLAARAKEAGALFHTDAVQAFGKVAIDARKVPFDLLSISGHKIGAPKGIGAMFIRRGTPLHPLLHGGTQDRGRRPGTENVAFAVGLATAAELAVSEREAEWARLEELRDTLEAMIMERVPDAVIHARTAPRAPHITNVSVPGTESESMLMALDLNGVAASAGSACQTGAVSVSHVLSSLGVPTDIAAGAIRLSLGKLSTPENVTQAAEVFAKLVKKARRVTISTI